jgi:hypothetical protein
MWGLSFLQYTGQSLIQDMARTGLMAENVLIS